MTEAPDDPDATQATDQLKNQTQKIGVDQAPASACCLCEAQVPVVLRLAPG